MTIPNTFSILNRSMGYFTFYSTKFLSVTHSINQYEKNLSWNLLRTTAVEMAPFFWLIKDEEKNLNWKGKFMIFFRENSHFLQLCNFLCNRLFMRIISTLPKQKRLTVLSVCSKCNDLFICQVLMLQQKLVKAFASILVERTPPKMFFNNSLSGQYHLIQAKTVAARFHFRSARLKLGLGWILTIKSGDCFIYHHHWLAWKKVTTLFNIVALGRSKEPPFSYRRKRRR